MPSFVYEKALHRKSYKLIAGVDEVGRGPLAGPVVAAAVIFPPHVKIKGLNDSKKLSPKRREQLFKIIRKEALGIGVAEVSHKVIDKINILQASLLAMRRAVDGLPQKPDHLLIDGGRIRVDLPIPQRGIPGGDSKVASIAAASIIAKVTRDRIMMKYHGKYPRYRFDRHKGYGTKRHMKTIEKYGPCPIHRRSFYPVSSISA